MQNYNYKNLLYVYSKCCTTLILYSFEICLDVEFACFKRIRIIYTTYVWQQIFKKIEQPYTYKSLSKIW